jgi:hypothetical protein
MEKMLRLAIPLLLSLPLVAFSQVSNNKIQNRIELQLDSGWFTSSTVNADVEWDCINKSLTNKCLIYHNDQWFTIKPSTQGPFFLNVLSQQCKKLYGVQMVVIEGDPCKTTSYKLKKCIPFSDQSDFFVRLDSLIAGREYLINIDGYLGDFCKFSIEFSSTHKGIPVEARNQNAIQLAKTLQDSILHLEWTIPDSLLFM